MEIKEKIFYSYLSGYDRKLKTLQSATVLWRTGNLPQLRIFCLILDSLDHSAASCGECARYCGSKMEICVPLAMRRQLHRHKDAYKLRALARPVRLSFTDRARRAPEAWRFF